MLRIYVFFLLARSIKHRTTLITWQDNPYIMRANALLKENTHVYNKATKKSMVHQSK